MKVIFTIPGKPCSVNKMYCNSRSGRFLSPHGKAFKYSAIFCARAAASCAKILRPDCKGTYRLTISFFFDSNRSDVDNCIKPVMDSLSGVFYCDDKQVYEILAIKNLDKGNSRTVIMVEGI